MRNPTRTTKAVPSRTDTVAYSTVPARPMTFERSAIFGDDRADVAVPAGRDRVGEILAHMILVRGVENTQEARDQAMVWFRTVPLPGFGGRTALDLVDQGMPDAVVRYLHELEDGGYA